MEIGNERRKYQRQQVALPLRVAEEDTPGKTLYQGSTVNVGAGGVYFRTPNWQDLRPGMAVHVTIDVPPDMFQLLPFGGLRGSGKVIRIEDMPAKEDRTDGGVSAAPRGVAIRMTSRLRFDSELHLPNFESRPRTQA